MAQPNERIVVGILVILMLLTGTVNTIATKYQDIVCVKFNEDGSCKRYFEHFAVQSAEMFLGEVLCLIPCLFGGAVYDTEFYHAYGSSASTRSAGGVQIWVSSGLERKLIGTAN